MSVTNNSAPSYIHTPAGAVLAALGWALLLFADAARAVPARGGRREVGAANGVPDLGLVVVLVAAEVLHHLLVADEDHLR